MGLIGPNGAGKTTLVNLLTGFDLPSRGQITLGGTDITRWPPYRRGRAGLARTFQHGRLFGELSVRENVEVAALGARTLGARGAPARRRAARAARARGARARTAPACSRTATSASSASRARSRCARASCSWTSPPPGCTRPRSRRSRRSSASSTRDFGAGVLLIDHNVALIMDVCDRVHVLDRGVTLAAGHAGRDPRATSTSRPPTWARK